ncbi:MAG: glycosyltransferase family 39 protein, partial [Anaerolineae bacterium]|nr:glycosyltransferase family 39 protein [Anaerolineae bacterium]
VRETLKKRSRKAGSRRSQQQRTAAATQVSPRGKVAAPAAARRPTVQVTDKDLPLRVGMAVLAGLFLLTRLPRLTLHGLYYDEATYLYWGQVIGADRSQRFIGAAWGGKQPLHSWLVALTEGLIADPVFAGRFVSVITGALTAIAIWLLAQRLFSYRVAILAVLLYIICPFTLLFDRQALIDSLLAASVIWIIYLSIVLLDRQDTGAVAGMAAAFGAALLTKSVGQWFPILIPAALLVVTRADLPRERLGRWLLAVVLALTGGFAIYYIAFGSSEAARLIPQFEQQWGKYAMSLAEILAFPWQQWQANATAVAGYLVQLLTVPLLLAAIAALLALPWLGRRAWPLAIWAVLPIVGQIAIASRFYDRYILFSIPPLLILIARFLEWAYQQLATWPSLAGETTLRRPAKELLSTAILAVLLLPATILSLNLLTNVEKVNQMTGGFYGLWGLRDYLTERAKASPIYLIANYSPAPVEDGSAVLLRDVPGIRLLRLAPPRGKLTIFDPVTMQIYPKERLAGQEVYYANSEGAETNSWLAGRLELAQSFPNRRGKGDTSYVGLYRIRFDDSFQ